MFDALNFDWRDAALLGFSLLAFLGYLTYGRDR